MSTSVIGPPFWAAHIAETCLDDRFQARAISGLRNALRHLPTLLKSDRIIVLGYGLPDTISRKIWFFLVFILWAIRPKCHIYFYWIGSDVYRPFQRTPVTGLYVRLAQHRRIHHICGAQWFADPLKQIGIDAAFMLFPYDTKPAKTHADTWPDTAQMRVVTYLTPSHWDNSNGQWIADAARSRPDISWTVIGMSGDAAPDAMQGLENISFLGWVDNPADIMADAHLFVRLTHNDAYAGTIRDAQAMRRIVIFSKAIKDAIVIDATRQDSFDKAFLDIAGVFSKNDQAGITSLRSTGDDVPDYRQTAKGLCDFLVAAS